MPLISMSPENLAHAGRHAVVPEIHEQDFVFQFVRDTLWKGDVSRAIHNYYELGNYSAKLAKEFSDEVERVSNEVKLPWSPSKVLDFASGYGCVARHLKNHFPNSQISACDIHQDAVTFIESHLGIEALLSNSSPELLSLPKQDLIICLSFFSHMPERTYARWLNALVANLAPRGVLLFTSNGYVTNRKLFPDWEMDDRGYAFRPASEQHDLDRNEYGLTLASFPFVSNLLKGIESVRLTRFQEGVWWAVQDVYICQRL